MSFNKLLLIFALASISFGKAKKNADPDTLRVYYESGILDGSTLTYDMSERADFYGLPMKSALISDFDKFNTTASVNNSDFIISPLLDEHTLSKYKTSKDIEEGCAAVEEVFDIQRYGLYGYAALALEGADIAPSITALIKNGPSLLEFKNVPADETITDTTIELTCGGKGGLFTTYGLRKSGVVGTDCIPNTGIPQSTAACTKEEGQNEPKLKGYFEGHIYNANAATLKDALIRFGPVALESEKLASEKGILLGWYTEGTQNYWIMAFPLGIGYDYLESIVDFGILKEVVVLLGPIKDCTSGQFPDTHYCQCVSTDTICLAGPIKPECTSGQFPDTHFCKCAATDTVCLAGPIKPECVKPAADTQEYVCPCPTDKESQQYKDDVRTQPKGICASGSVRMTLGMIAAVVIIPVLALLF